MAARSIRAFVKGIQSKLNLKEEECTKFIIGSDHIDFNEVLMSNEKIVAGFIIK